MKFINKKILSISCLIGSVGLLVISIAYAWFASFNEVGNMQFQILQIDSLVNLYKANDINDNGVPDLLQNDKFNKYLNLKEEDPNNGNYMDYSNYYYKEKYDFSLLDSKYALSKDSEANLLQTISLNNMAPSKIYTIKFEATNYSIFENNLYFSFDENTSLEIDFLKQFEVRFGKVSTTSPNTENEIVNYEFSNWTNFVSSDATSYTGLKINDENNPYILPIYNKYEGENAKKNGKIDFWLQIKISDDATIIKTETFTLPTFRMTFEIENIENN